MLLAHSLSEKERTKDVLLDQNVSFSTLVLPEPLLKGLTASGFEKPSPIQLRALPIGRCGFDLIVKSKSGTGKTLVFSIIALEAVKLAKTSVQALILAPTREIAVQIKSTITSIGQFYQGLSVATFIGGLPLEDDKRNCKSCHIAVGTPGRVKQLIEINHLCLKNVKVFIMDEADKLTEDSYVNDINHIFNKLPKRKQVVLASATCPKPEFLEKYLHTAVSFSEEFQSPLLLGVSQYVRILFGSSTIVQQTNSKNNELLKALNSLAFTQCVIFTNYQTRAESISYYLNRNGWESIYISAAQKQVDRLKSLADLKEFKKRILVTTDLTARGIDASNVDLVINYDIPQDAATYMHRMGRAGRYGSKGVYVNLAFTGTECETLKKIIGLVGGASLTIPVLKENYSLTDFEDHLIGKMIDSVEFKNHFNKNLRDNREDLNDKYKFTEKVYEKCNSETADEEDEFETQVIDQRIKDQNKSLDEKLPMNDDDFDPHELLKQIAASGTVDNLQPVTPSVVCKNKALIGVAKALMNQDVSVEDMSNMSSYMSSLKDTSTFFDQDDIFAYAYDSMTKTGAGRWQNLLPPDDIPKLSKDYQQPDNDEDYEDEEEYDEDYDFEVEKDVEVNIEPMPGIMEWVPVQPTKKSRIQPSSFNEIEPTTSTTFQSTSHEVYRKYFDHCSNNLWETGLRFETVNSFDQWFCNDWERQLNAVQSFVQNKIYLEEMSKK